MIRSRRTDDAGSRTARRVWLALLLAGVAVPAPAIASTTTPGTHRAPARAYLDARTSVPSRALLAALATATTAIPSFSRQTGMACSMCHNQFPQLTPFGRLFKLNGYTMTGLATIAGGDTLRPSLKLSPIPPVSAMLVASLTRTGKALPAAQNNSAMLPDQASLFLGGQVTPSVGAFIQFTYAAIDGSFGVDNIDLRYASHTTWMDKDLLFGATLHNNPTVQDPWNTVPAWTYPFMSSSVAPTPNASTLLEGGLSQQVLGLGGYALWDNLLYMELTAYRSAQQGGAAPLDSGSHGVIDGAIPYGRIAVQHAFGPTYVMAGGFGLLGAKLFPAGVSGVTDHYTTLGLDAQVERKLDEGGAMLVGRTSFIHEAQTLDASFAAAEAEHPTAHLETFRANVSYLPNTYVGATLGYFSTAGSADVIRFPTAELTGSLSGSPESRGMIGELSVNPWQNLRLSAQYIAYNRFNGSSDVYDVVGGRRASDNNTLYLYTWMAF